MSKSIKKVPEGVRSPKVGLSLQNIKEGVMCIENKEGVLEIVEMSEKERLFYSEGLFSLLMYVSCEEGSVEYKALENLLNIKELERLNYKGLAMQKLQAYVYQSTEEGVYVRFYYNRYIRSDDYVSSYEEEIEELKREAIKLYSRFNKGV